MAEALARGFIARGVVKASAMVATDPVQARRDVFESFNVKPVESNAEVRRFVCIVLFIQDTTSHCMPCLGRPHPRLAYVASTPAGGERSRHHFPSS